MKTTKTVAKTKTIERTQMNLSNVPKPLQDRVHESSETRERSVSKEAVKLLDLALVSKTWAKKAKLDRIQQLQQKYKFKITIPDAAGLVVQEYTRRYDS